MEHSTSMQARAKLFIAEMASEVEAVSAASGASSGKHLRLDSVMGLSHAALSHRQFFDPLVKQRDAVMNDVSDCERRLRRVRDGHDDPLEFHAWDADTINATPEPQGATPAPGGMILF